MREGIPGTRNHSNQALRKKVSGPLVVAGQRVKKRRLEGGRPEWGVLDGCSQRASSSNMWHNQAQDLLDMN